MDQSPFSILSASILNNRPILVFIRNNRKLLGYLRAYDSHLNLILENVKELKVRIGSFEKSDFQERFFSKLILRGDSVVMIIPV